MSLPERIEVVSCPNSPFGHTHRVEGPRIVCEAGDPA